jgi:hypothetical protein
MLLPFLLVIRPLLHHGLGTPQGLIDLLGNALAAGVDLGCWERLRSLKALKNAFFFFSLRGSGDHKTLDVVLARPSSRNC